MKKLIVAFDNMHYSEGAMQFIGKLHQLRPISLTGIFLPPLNYSALWSVQADTMSGGFLVPIAKEEEALKVKTNTDRFTAFCEQHKIHYTVKKEFFDYGLDEFEEQTRFADLLVIGSEAFYRSMGTEHINQYLKDALHHVACPVLLVPEKCSFPETNILTYDGSEASVFAIKQFSYLFPELVSRKTLVVYVDENPKALIPEEKSIKDLVCRHYEQTTFMTLHIDAQKYLTTWLREQQGGILVSGSFGRSGITELFRRSFIYEVITDHQVPVFIAHK